MDNRRELPGEREPILASYLAPSPGTETGEDDLRTLVKLSLMIWKRKWLVFLGMGLGAVVAVVISLQTIPMYRGSTSLEIQNIQEPFQMVVGSDTTQVQVTHAELLGSKSVKGRAAARVAAKTVPPMKMKQPLSVVREWLGMKDPIELVPWSDAVLIAAGTVSVIVPKDSRILTIQSESPNPQATEAFLNALVEEYIQQLGDKRWEGYQNTSGMLDVAQDELKQKVEQSEQNVTNLAKSAGLIVMASDTQSLAEHEFKQLQSDLAAARSDRVAIEAKYRASLAGNPGLDSGPMAGYQNSITEMRRKLAELSTTFTADHYKVREVQEQIDELQIAMDKERANIKSRLEMDYRAAQERENGLQKEFEKKTRALADQAQMVSQYNMAKREAEINQKLYETTLQKGKEASVSSVIRANNARVADPAKVSGVPYTPVVRFNLTLGMLAGLCLGALGAIFMARMDASIKNPDALEAYFNVRALGAIPSAKSERLGVLTRRGPVAIGGAGATSVGALGSGVFKSGESSDPMECLELVTWTRQRSVMSEAFRAVMTSILFSSQDADQSKVLLVTSPATQEGKSTVISNLAIALAEIGQRVLLIDGDMRLPRIHQIFGLPNVFGLSGVLNERQPVGDYDLDRLVTNTFVPNLQVMTAGEAPTSLSRLLHSGRMKDLIERFRGEFDTILIDSAPVLTVPDARVLARAADAVILVFRAHKTTQEAAMAVAKCLEEDGTRVLGTILNDWNPKPSGQGYGRGYGAYTQYHNSSLTKNT